MFEIKDIYPYLHIMWPYLLYILGKNLEGEYYFLYSLRDYDM